MTHPQTPHWCGKGHCALNAPSELNPFCGARGGPGGPNLACMRIAGHGGPHSAYSGSITHPQEWEQ